MARTQSPAPDQTHQTPRPQDERPNPDTVEPAAADQAIDIAGTEADEPAVGEAVEPRPSGRDERDPAIDEPAR